MDLQANGTQLAVEQARVWVFELAYGQLVAGLMLEFQDVAGTAAPRAFPELLADVDNRRHDVRLGERSIWETCLDACAACAAALQGRRLGPDMHHMTFYPAQTLDRSELDLDAVQRLVSRRDAPSRREHLTVRTPAEGNRYHEMLVAVTPGASAFAGHHGDVELAYWLSAIQLIGGLSALRSIQRRAHERLRHLRQTAQTRELTDLKEERERLSKASAELASLLLDLSFGVEAYLDMRMLIPSLPVEEYHRELGIALGIPRGCEVTASMLDRLSTVLDAERVGIAEREQEQVEKFRGRIERFSFVAGGVAVMAAALGLVFAYLGTNVREVEGSGSSIASLGTFGIAYAAIIAALVVSGLTAFVLAQRRPGDD
jgi:hypothetical protein